MDKKVHIMMGNKAKRKYKAKGREGVEKISENKLMEHTE